MCKKDNSSILIGGFLTKNSHINNPKYRYYRKENGGLSVARNYGISKANSDIIAFIDEDAVADENFSMNIINTFKEHEKVNCIGGYIELLNENNKFARIIQSSIFSFQMRSDYTIIGTNMAFRKSFLYKTGGFQPEFTYRGDERALFVNARKNLMPMKVKTIKVKHQQPANMRRWLRTRYENGYFGAAISDLAKSNLLNQIRSLLICSISLFTPIVSVLFFTLKSPLLVVISLLYLMFLAKRFIISNEIANYLDEYQRYNNKRSRIVRVYIGFIVVSGYYAQDIGYLKGYFKYKRYPWKKGNFITIHN